MRNNQCSNCHHYALYVMPIAGKTICAHCKNETVNPIVKNGKCINDKT